MSRPSNRKPRARHTPVRAMPRRRWLLALATLVTCAVLVSLLFQRPDPVAIPQPPVRFMEDRAHLVSPAFAAAKNQYLEHLSRTMRIAHINVVILPRAPSPEIEDFSVRAATAWKIGAAGADNGLALFVFRDERVVRLEVGYGLESVITDATASRLLAQTIVPAFARGQYESGLEDFLDLLDRTLEASEAAERRASQGVGMIPFVLTVLRNSPVIASKVWRTFLEAETEARIVISLFALTLAALAVQAVAGILRALPAIVLLPWRLYISPTLRSATPGSVREQFSAKNFFARPPPVFVDLAEELDLGTIVTAVYILAAVVTGIATLFVGSGLFMDGLGRFGGAGATLVWPGSPST
ncbi:MAG: TPM domain-containing protein [Ramlibacter sp.]